MLDAGEDPLYLARRVVRMAVEDIGLADPQALVVANAAKDAYDFLGSPEGELAIAEAVIYVATAPKSNAAYAAFGAAMRMAKQAGSLVPPKHILNAPTKLMQAEGYGRGYEYDHAAEEAFSGQDYFPEALGRQTFYDPPERGFEREIRKRLELLGEAAERTGRGQELMHEFDCFVGIDWSGAKGIAQKGIQAAIASPGRQAPVLQAPAHGHRWSRSKIADWIGELVTRKRALIGLDFAFGFPSATELGIKCRWIGTMSRPYVRATAISTAVDFSGCGRGARESGEQPVDKGRSLFGPTAANE